jgi:5'(3')-deoxyribonucleotidase
MKCLLDLDGVIADFHTAWYQKFNQFQRPDAKGTWSIAKLHNITFEESCQGLDIEFWKNIPWMYDGKIILTLLEDAFGKKNISILTSNHVVDTRSAAYGKVRWIEENLPDYKYKYFIGGDKSFLAHKGMMLIDDKNENVDNFRMKGGHAFLVPREWNRGHLDKDQVQYQLIKFLRNWF